VFAGILDADAGHWSIAPTGPYRTQRRYLPGTLVIESGFSTETGSVKLTDAMAFAEGQRGHDLGLDAPRLLLRLVEGLAGEVELAIELAPRPEYGLWVALDRAIALAPHLGPSADIARWRAEREQIREAVLTRGWSETRHAYTQSFESDHLDAGALLMPIMGFLPATDERMRATIEAIAADLTKDRLVLRYMNEEGLNSDGLRGEEGTFVICSFWLVTALAMAGEVQRAEELFDTLTSYANDLGLLAEEIDTAKGQLLGNFPQAFSHVGLIIAASAIDKARRHR
jgi:hypothetical protein